MSRQTNLSVFIESTKSCFVLNPKTPTFLPDKDLGFVVGAGGGIGAEGGFLGKDEGAIVHC